MANENTSTNIGILFPDDLFKRIETERKRREALAGVDIQKSSFIRALVAERLDELENSGA